MILFTKQVYIHALQVLGLPWCVRVSALGFVDALPRLVGLLFFGLGVPVGGMSAMDSACEILIFGYRALFANPLTEGVMLCP
jgi:hypothetical protein